MQQQNFSYDETDEEGLETLKIISDSDKLNNWIYQQLKHFLKGHILELGSGIGNITAFAIKDHLDITASDIRVKYCDFIKERFGNDIPDSNIKIINITHPDFEQEYSNLLNKFDTIFTINTIEHIEDDVLAVKNCKKLLRTNGNLIILVPALPALYNRFDIELKHYRRYSKTSLRQLFIASGFAVVNIRYFNFAGIFGWWFSGSVLKKKIIPKNQMKLFNLLVPVFKMLDFLTGNKLGLSVIAIVRVK